MDPVLWGLLPASACTAQGGAVADRIVKPGYDALDRVTSSTSGYGTTAASTDSVAYSANGQTLSTTDGETNRTGYSYDGFDRLSELHYPIKTGTKPASSTTDYQAYQYDANGNVTALRLRDATQVGFAYDALNRQITKTRPSSEGVVSYGYDLTGRMTSAGDSASGITETLSYDALSRLTSDAGLAGTLGYAYDLAGRRTRVTWPDGYYATYDYLVTGEVQAVRENGASSGVGQLGVYAYDDLGRRTSLTRGNGTVTGYGYDASQPLGWMTSLSQDLTAAREDLTVGFTYNAAGQFANRSASNDLYSYGGYAPKSETASVNGLNQATAIGAAALGYDARGNATAIGAASYAYTSDNLLKAAGTATLKYDPLDRLIDYDTGTSTRFLRDGGGIAAEVTPTGAVLKRYVWGLGADELLLWYEGAGTTDRRFAHQDERGSVIAVTDSAGATLGLNRYDEYGVPSSGNIGRIGYTGQAWLPELGLYDYKARMYAPALGRFLQTDPIGYAGGMNLYAYVGGDPVNATDPSGTFGLFGGCPIGSRCTSTNPDASNRAAAQSKLEAQGFSSSVASQAVDLAFRYGSATKALSSLQAQKPEKNDNFINISFGKSDCVPGLINPCGSYLPIELAYKHISEVHFGSKAGESVFLNEFRNINSMQALYSLASVSSVPIPYGNNPNVYSISTYITRPVGYERGSMEPSYLVSFIIYQSGITPTGRPIFTPSNGYPGLP